MPSLKIKVKLGGGKVIGWEVYVFIIGQRVSGLQVGVAVFF